MKRGVILTVFLMAIIFSGCNFLQQYAPGPSIKGGFKLATAPEPEPAAKKPESAPQEVKFSLKILGLKKELGYINLYGLKGNEKIMIALGTEYNVFKTIAFVKKHLNKNVLVTVTNGRQFNLPVMQVVRLEADGQVVETLVEKSEFNAIGRKAAEARAKKVKTQL